MGMTTAHSQNRFCSLACATDTRHTLEGTSAFPDGTPFSSRPTIIRHRHKQTQLLPAADIVYIEVFNHELHIHTRQGATLCVRGSLTSIEQQLCDSRFMRCHKSFLVCLPYVTDLHRYRITLANGTQLPVSKQNYLAIQQTLDAYSL